MDDYAIAPLPPHDDARFAIQYGGLDVESAREAARIIARLCRVGPLSRSLFHADLSSGLRQREPYESVRVR